MKPGQKQSSLKSLQKNDERLWPSDFSKLDADSVYEFMLLCRTWDEAGRQIREFPDREYLKHVAAEWIDCRKTGTPLIIEKSRRLVTSWALRCIELYDLGLSRGNALITHTKRDDAAGHVWRIFFLYSNLRQRFPSWDLPYIATWGNELSQQLDIIVLGNRSKVSQYFEKPSGMQGTGYSIVTMEELSIYRHPAGMYDQATRLVESPADMANGLVVGVTNYAFNDSYELVINGASPSPY